MQPTALQALMGETAGKREAGKKTVCRTGKLVLRKPVFHLSNPLLLVY
jgi:hypothetical protein